jgi:hypothetical protein
VLIPTKHRFHPSLLRALSAPTRSVLSTPSHPLEPSTGALDRSPRGLSKRDKTDMHLHSAPAAPKV